VNVYLGLIRLPEHETDILITLNEPVMIAADSSSARAVLPTTTVVGTAQSAILEASSSSSATEVCLFLSFFVWLFFNSKGEKKKVMRLILLTLRVNDWTLFDA